MARRIVPELISPSQAAAVQPAFKSIAEQPLNLRFDLKEQAELAKTMLEPGRKIYVDISDDSKVNWRKACRYTCCRPSAQRASFSHVTSIMCNLLLLVAKGSWGSEDKATAEGSSSNAFTY